MSTSTVRRHLAAVLIGVFAAAGLVAVIPVADACACGGVVHSPESMARVNGETSILQADDPEALQTWLKSHGCAMRPGLAQQVKPYVAEGWSFVAVRLTREGRDLVGTLPPLEMKFPSSTIVYSMRMSRAAITTSPSASMCSHGIGCTAPTPLPRAPAGRRSGMRVRSTRHTPAVLP